MTAIIYKITGGADNIAFVRGGEKLDSYIQESLDTEYVDREKIFIEVAAVENSP